MKRKNSLNQTLSRLEYAKRISGDIIDIKKEHICSREFCNPQNENDLIYMGFLQGPPQTSDIYLCKYKVHHICNDMLCKETDISGVCTISGACYGPPGGYSMYDKNDYRTWTSKFRRNEKMLFVAGKSNGTQSKLKKRKCNSTKTRTEATMIVTKLLFSPTRKRINEKYNMEMKKICHKKIQSYVKSCIIKREPINLIYIMILNHMYNNGFQKLEILSYNQTLVDKYVDIITKVYNLVSKHHEKILKITNIAIGVLYEMRQGYTIENTLLLTRDDFLLHNLPMISDIPSFEFNRSSITNGKHIIQKTFIKIIESGEIINFLDQ